MFMRHSTVKMIYYKVASACNPALRKLRQKDPEFRASLGYTMKLYLK